MVVLEKGIGTGALREAARCLDAREAAPRHHRRKLAHESINHGRSAFRLSHQPRAPTGEPMHKCGQAQCLVESLGRRQCDEEFITWICRIRLGGKYVP